MSRLLFHQCTTFHPHCLSDWILKHFQIGVTNADPKKYKPVVVNYPVCAHSTQKVPVGAKKVFDCDARGRHLLLQYLGTAQLTLCEVEVYGLGKYFCIVTVR